MDSTERPRGPREINVWAVTLVVLLIVGGVALNTLYDDVQWMMEGEPADWTAVLRPSGDLDSGRMHRLYARNEMADQLYVLDANLEPWTFEQLSQIAFGFLAAFFALLGARKHLHFSRARRA